MIRGPFRAAGVFLLAGVACSSDPAGTSRCVFENGAVSTGRCLTECESRCALYDRAGCAGSDCIAGCEAAAGALSAACADARYAEWRCLRTKGLPSVTCEGTVPVSAVPEGVCQTETGAVTRACPGDRPARDAGARD